MSKLHKSSILLICCLACYGCSLEAPCDTDEFYTDGICIKCHDMSGYHISADNRCIEDTVSECGDGKIDCMSGEGIVQAECFKGSCLVIRCDEDNGYVPDKDHCKLSIPMDEADCGLNHYNCRKSGIKTVACVNSSDVYQCNVTECDLGYHMVDNSNSDEISWMPKVCTEDTEESCGITQENCYDKTGAEHVVCLNGKCQILSCNSKLGYISDNSSAEMQCVPSTENNDYDKALNYEDACPNNPSKWDKSIWGENGENQGGCDVMDSDLDDKDDSEDVCPTRKDIQTIEQLKSKGLCSGDSCPTQSEIATATAEQKAVWCGIIDNSGEIPAYHIYHVDDIEVLRAKLVEIYNSYRCADTTESCLDSNHKKACNHGYQRIYYCSCSTNDEGITCRSPSLEPIPMQIEIFLEDDIDLNHNSLDNYKVWYPLTLFAAHLDGKSHKISFKLHNDAKKETGRNFLNAFIDEASLSVIENLTLDIDVKAYGHSLLVNTLSSSDLKNITIQNARLEYKAPDAQGVGLLAGRAEDIQGRKGKISNITIENSEVVAENATNVGGMIGFVNSVEFSNTLQSTLNRVSGYQNVGGMFGNISRFNFSDIFINRIKSIEGHLNVGGFAGCIDSNESTLKAYDSQTGKSQYWAYNAVKSIKGTDSVGGFIGSGNKKQGMAAFDSYVYNRIGDIYGDSNVSGFIAKYTGYNSSVSHLYNRVNKIHANHYVSGASSYESSFYGASASYIYNDIDVIEPLDPNTPGTIASGLFTSLGSGVVDAQAYKIFNHIGRMGRYNVYSSGLIARHFKSNNSPSEGITIHHVHSEVNFDDNSNPAQSGLIFTGDKKATIHCVSSYANGISSEQNGFIGSAFTSQETCTDIHTIRNSIIMVSKSSDDLSCQSIINNADSHQFKFANVHYYKPADTSTPFKNDAEICSFSETDTLGSFTDGANQVEYMNNHTYRTTSETTSSTYQSETCDTWKIRTFKPGNGKTEISLPAVFDKDEFFENYFPYNKHGDEIEAWFNKQ